MAIVNVSVDTKTRKATLAVDGVLVPALEFRVGKWYDSYEDQEILTVGWTIEVETADGMKETRQFYLPEAHAEAIAVDENGLASRLATDDQKAVNDIGEFLKRDS